MLFAVAKVFIAAVVISFSSWLAGKRPELAGFIIALPIATLLALPFSYIEFQDPDTTVKYARSILVAIPLSLFFFIPFLLANKLQGTVIGGFWGMYLSGIVCLGLAYLIHRFVTQYL